MLKKLFHENCMRSSSKKNRKMLSGKTVSELASKRARLAAEIAALDTHLESRLQPADDVAVRPLKQARMVPEPLRTCVACLDTIADGAYIFTCQKSSEHVICASCVPHALQSVAKEDSSALTENGLCLTHMSSACSRTTGRGLIDYVSQYIPDDLGVRLKLHLARTSHLKVAVVRPLSCMVLCPSCGDTASLDIPKTVFNVPPFIICRRCPQQPPWCLECHKNVVGPFYERAKQRCNKTSFSFVNVVATYTRCAQGVPQCLAANGPLDHSTCASLTCLKTVLDTVRGLKVSKASAAVPDFECPKPIPFPSLAVRGFYDWALTKHKPMPGFDDCGTAKDVVSVFPSEMDFLSTVRHILSRSSANALLLRRMCMRVLNIMFERALAQRCRKCGKAGVKDLSCTHIACCGKTWCYICEDVVSKKRGVVHCCPLTLQRGRLDGVSGEGMVGAAQAVEWFHVAKRAYYVRTWLHVLGISAGWGTLLAHASWKPFIAEHASKVFVTDAEQRWVATMRCNPDVLRECYL